MQLPSNITPEGHTALVECLMLFARRGRQLREAREREQKAKLALPVGEPAASLAETHGTLSFAGVSTDA